tara:strand:+ start:3689 stop:3895 length:207 start_codon:yes stop_codon:yes gene_type:complete
MFRNIYKNYIPLYRLCSTKHIIEDNVTIKRDNKEKCIDDNDESDTIVKDYEAEFEPRLDYNVEKYKDE